MILWWLPAASALLGLLLGSFLSMLIPRLHEGKKGIVMGRSECPHCQHTLSPVELIPLVSYLWQRGRCRQCKHPISAWYPATEIMSVLGFTGWGLWVASFANVATWAAGLPIVLVLLFIFIDDLRYKEIHDVILIPGLIYAGGWAIAEAHLTSSLIGVAFAIVFFGGQWVLSKGRWIGSGDLFIGAFLALLCHWELLVLGTFLGYFLGSVIGLSLMLTKKATRNTALPLGPFLIAGNVLAWVYGDFILHQLFFL